MTIPTILLVPCVAVVLLVAALLVARLLEGWFRSRGAAKSDTGGEDLIALRAARDRALATLRDLEFEYEMGKLSASDHRDLVAFYEQEAVRLLEQLEATG